MATKVKQMPRPASGRRRYPWDEWLNGEAWKLRRGVDFESEIYNFRNLAHLTARRRGLRVQTVIDGDTIYVQAASA